MFLTVAHSTELYKVPQRRRASCCLEQKQSWFTQIKIIPQGGKKVSVSPAVSLKLLSADYVWWIVTRKLITERDFVAQMF